MPPGKTLVIGLGNPILGDDGVGCHVAGEVCKRLPSPPTPSPPFDYAQGRPFDYARGERGDVEVDCASLGGLNLMERLVGYARVILIDAMDTGQKPVGTVSAFPLDELPDPTAGHSASAHDTTLKTALEAGRKMSVQLPNEIFVVAIEAQSMYNFSEELSPPVAAAVPVAVQMVMELLQAASASQGGQK